MSTGRTPEIADEVLARLSEGEPLRAILRSDPERFPGKSQWYAWMAEDEDLAARFRQAREEGADAIAEECLEIADDARNDWMERQGEDGQGEGFQLNGEHVQRSKLRIHTRMQLLAKWFPQRYGDKVAMEHTGPGGGPVQTVTRIERRIVKAE
ncbi:putative phage-related protein [Pseudoxanthomonas suwonensis 11-1]|uniref:Putative phage-related protein n=1 Tax=Pseudoxanthomonas suwonensis (strain 11-1) TaxID=743721 RepID=E6WS63_PSEUU|nr:hypothetical protein [Pseudoxanthomonas suwonensis]ADV27012.1 putative phage-related protein [Pseudoxanthomonas suwonensis 11-1]